jgi:hypothetical protein
MTRAYLLHFMAGLYADLSRQICGGGGAAAAEAAADDDHVSVADRM